MNKIIDCITYFDEDILLDFRLNVLENFVDYFVIVEAKEDHQGNKKKKACKGAILSWVRIPFSPPLNKLYFSRVI